MAREEAMAELTEEESEEEGEGEERGQRGVEEGGGGRVPEAGVNAEAEQEAQEDAPGEDEEGGGYSMDWGLMLLLVLMDENSTLLVVCMCWTAGYPWISMDIEYVDIHGYPWMLCCVTM